MSAKEKFKLHITWKGAVLLLAELALLIWGVCGLFAGERMLYDREQIESGALAFAPGVYRAHIVYEAKTDDKNKLAVTFGDYPYKGVLSNEIALYAGDTEAESVFWVTADVKDVQIKAINGEEKPEDFQLKELTVYHTNMGSRLFVFFVLLLSLLINGCLIFYRYDRRVGVSVRSKLVFCILAGTVVISSVPLLADYVLSGHDVGYHLLRIEGLWKGWLAGYFPVRIQPDWMRGHGYATAVFYGDTFLTVPALLRLLGFPVVSAYKAYVFLINTATVLISYFSFKGIFRGRRAALLGSMLYSLNAYRLYDLYVSATVGEYTAMTFLPLLCYGFYKIYTEDVRGRKYGRYWVPIALGLSGIIQCHVLSCEMTAAFIVALCLILWKKTFRRETFWVLSKAVLFTLLLNAWFLIPFLDYMLTEDFYVKHAFGRMIQTWGLYPAHLARVFYDAGNSVMLDLNGMVATGAYSLGAALTAGYFFYIYLHSIREFWAEGAERRLGRLAFGIGTAAVLMSLVIFPWDSLQKANGILNSLISALQFPNRLLSIAAIAFTLLTCVTAREIWRRKNRLRCGVFLTVVAGLCLAGSLYQVDAMLYQHPLYRIYTGESMGNTYVGGAEYLPAGTAQYSVFYDKGTPGPGVTIEAFEKDRYELHTEAVCLNEAGQESFVELPVFAYKGYQAWDADSGELLAVSSGNNENVRVSLPEGYHGRVVLDFVSPWYWRAAEAVTAVSVLGLLLWKALDRKKRRAAPGQTGGNVESAD